MYRYLQMICTTSCQLSTVHIVTHSAISKQQTYPTHTHLTHFTLNNNNCTTFICTEQHWKVILTVTYCLQSADSQHSHCCCWPTNTLTAVHYTNSTTFVSPSAELKLFVLLLHWTLWYQQNFLLLFREVTGCLSYSCFNALKINISKHCAENTGAVVIAAVSHWGYFTSSKLSSAHQVSNVALSTNIVRPLLRHSLHMRIWGNTGWL